MDSATRDAWAAKHGLKPSPRRQGWHGFVGRNPGREFTASGVEDNHLRAGWDDHGEVWVRDTPGRRGFKHAAAYTSHPYDLDQDDRDRLAQMASKYGLKVEIRPKAESWYYPGQTWLVILSDPDLDG